MPNYSKIGNYYIRQGGSDLNDGSEITPWKSLSKLSTGVFLATDVIVVGDGTYVESLNIRRCGKILADGVVTLQGNSLNSAIVVTTNVVNQIDGFRFINFSKGVERLSNPAVGKLTNCLFDNCGISFEINSNFEITTDFTGTIFKDGSDQSYTNNCLGILKNFTVINDDVSLNSRLGVFKLINSHFDQNSILRIPNSANCQLISNCNIQGQIEIDSVMYADLATAQVVWPNLIQNCISADPLFNPDYSLQANSPNLSSSADGTFIGAKGLGFNFSSLSAQSTNNIVNTSGTYTLGLGGNTGTITFNELDLGADYVLSTGTILGLEDYFNNEVVDSDITLLEPNYRTFEMKYCSQAEITAAGNITTALAAKPWLHFIRNREITIDSSGNSNYDANYDRLSEQPVVAGGVQIRITLRNNGVQS